MHDQHMLNWPDIKASGILKTKLPTSRAAYRERTGDLVYSKKLDTWDYPFTLTRIVNDGLAVIPTVNLIENIGFNQNATHTQLKPKYIVNKVGPFTDNIIHPNNFKINENFDQIVFRNNNPRPSLTNRIKASLIRLLSN